jgi:hypothetical protein
MENESIYQCLAQILLQMKKWNKIFIRKKFPEIKYLLKIITVEILLESFFENI